MSRITAGNGDLISDVVRKAWSLASSNSVTTFRDISQKLRFHEIQEVISRCSETDFPGIKTDLERILYANYFRSPIPRIVFEDPESIYTEVKKNMNTESIDIENELPGSIPRFPNNPILRRLKYLAPYSIAEVGKHIQDQVVTDVPNTVPNPSQLIHDKKSPYLIYRIEGLKMRKSDLMILRNCGICTRIVRDILHFIDIFFQNKEEVPKIEIINFYITIDTLRNSGTIPPQSIPSEEKVMYIQFEKVSDRDLFKNIFINRRLFEKIYRYAISSRTSNFNILIQLWDWFIEHFKSVPYDSSRRLRIGNEFGISSSF